VDYTRLKPGADVGKLHAELAAAALPVTSVRGPYLAGDIVVSMSRELDAMEVQDMDAVIELHDGRKRKPRSINAVYTDLAALSGAQKGNIWSYLMQPVDGIARWRHANREATWNAAAVGTAAPAGSTLEDHERALTATFWCLEHPDDFVEPEWDPTINVPGDELA